MPATSDCDGGIPADRIAERRRNRRVEDFCCQRDREQQHPQTSRTSRGFGDRGHFGVGQRAHRRVEIANPAEIDPAVLGRMHRQKKHQIGWPRGSGRQPLRRASMRCAPKPPRPSARRRNTIRIQLPMQIDHRGASGPHELVLASACDRKLRMLTVEGERPRSRPRSGPRPRERHPQDAPADRDR